MSWQVIVLGETFREGDLTIADLSALEDATGVKHGYFGTALGAEDQRTAEATVFRKLLAALLQRRLGLGEEDAFAKVDGLRKADVEVSTYDDLPSLYEEGFPPSADEPSTRT